MAGSEARSQRPGGSGRRSGLSPGLANTKRQGRARQLMRARPVADWRIPPCPRPNQAPSPNSKRDCPTHGCGALFFSASSFFLPSSILLRTVLVCIDATEGGGGSSKEHTSRETGRIQWPHCWGMKNKSGCWGRGAALEIQHPDMPSPDIRVTCRPSQAWAHGHVHLQILARP